MRERENVRRGRVTLRENEITPGRGECEYEKLQKGEYRMRDRGEKESDRKERV